MARPKQPWELQAIAAQRRDNELRKTEELKKVASYWECNTNKSRHHESWTTEGYYEKANKEAELLSEKKIKAAQLEERRKKLELMLFQENMEYQQELKELSSKPKLYKNGSYLNDVPTSTLLEINQGIMAKEEQLRKHEAELRLHHAWRLRQPELRAATRYIRSAKLKSHWLEQIVEKEMQKKQEEEENRRFLKERDEAIQRQIQMEQERIKEKENQMQELKSGLQEQISELHQKEKLVKQLRSQENKHKFILDKLKLIASERERELNKLVSERDAYIINMGLHKYKLKRKVANVLQEIELDLGMLEKLTNAVLKEYESEKDNCEYQKRVLDTALAEVKEHRERERQRQKTIEAMYDGEARQINDKQEKMWSKEREARNLLMKEVLASLKRQEEEKIKASIEEQKQNVLEREKLLGDVENYHEEVKARERETQLKNVQYSTINALQAELSNLRVQQQKAEEAVEKENEIKESIARERNIRREIAREASGAWM